MEFPILKTERCTLRRFQRSDIREVFSALGDPRITKFYGVHYNSVDHCEVQMKYFDEVESSGKGYWWAICNNDEALIGAAGLYR